MQTALSIKTFKAAATRLPANISVMSRGGHGLGKSSTVRQIRHRLLETVPALKGHEFPLIDRRVSQMTEGDVLGLPSTDGEVTRFNPPVWYKQACLEPCLLHLDEFNRGTKEVMQAFFQVALDRELNGWKLHPETRVFVSINTGGRYSVEEIDPALLDRFYAIDIAFDADEWCEWALNKDPVHGGGLDPLVPAFIKASKNTQGETWLVPPPNAENSDVHGTPRSWEMLNNVLVSAGLMHTPTDPLFHALCIGFVGVEAAIAFGEFIKNTDNRWTGEEIVNGYATHQGMRNYVTKAGQGHQNDILERAAEYITSKLSVVTPEQGANINALAKDLSEEPLLAFWGKLTKDGVSKIELIKSVHPYVVEEILAIFGVPLGEAGVGVVPNIPGIFQGTVQNGAAAAASA